MASLLEWASLSFQADSFCNASTFFLVDPSINDLYIDVFVSSFQELKDFREDQTSDLGTCQIDS